MNYIPPIMPIILVSLILLGCGGDLDSQKNQPKYDETDFSAIVGSWKDPKRNRTISIFENGDFFEGKLRHVEEVTQVQQNYFRVRPSQSKHYVLIYAHNRKVLLVIGSHFDRDLNMELSQNRKYNKAKIYEQHEDRVKAAIEIEKGNLNVVEQVNGYPLFEEVAIRVSDKPIHNYSQVKKELDEKKARAKKPQRRQATELSVK